MSVDLVKIPFNINLSNNIYSLKEGDIITVERKTKTYFAKWICIIKEIEFDSFCGVYSKNDITIYEHASCFINTNLVKCDTQLFINSNNDYSVVNINEIKKSTDDEINFFISKLINCNLFDSYNILKKFFNIEKFKKNEIVFVKNNITDVGEYKKFSEDLNYKYCIKIIYNK